MARGKQALRSPGRAGRRWALRAGGHSSVGAFSVPWAVDELLLIAVQGKGTWCLLECCFLGLCLCFRKLLPSTVTTKVCYLLRVAVGLTDVSSIAKPSPARTGRGTGRLPLTPQEMRASENLPDPRLDFPPTQPLMRPCGLCFSPASCTAALCQAFIPPRSLLFCRALTGGARSLLQPCLDQACPWGWPSALREQWSLLHLSSKGCVFLGRRTANCLPHSELRWSCSVIGKAETWCRPAT